MEGPVRVRLAMDNAFGDSEFGDGVVGLCMLCSLENPAQCDDE